MKRFLIVPNIFKKTVVDNAGYREFYNLTKIVSSIDSVYWYMVVPSWVQDGLLGHDRLTYVHLDPSHDRIINDIVGFPALEIARQFARRGGRNIIDGVVTDNVYFSAYLGKLLSDQNSKYDVPVFLRKHGKVSIDSDLDAILVAANYAASSVAPVSELNKNNIVASISENISPVVRRTMRKKMFLWTQGYDMSVVDRLRMVPKDNTLFVGGSFEHNVKKREQIKNAVRLSSANVLNSVLASCSKSYVVNRFLNDGDRTSFVSVKTGLGTDMYLSEMSMAGCFISFADSKWDSGDMEDELLRLMVGQVGVFPYVDVVVSILGEDYPFYYNDGNILEAAALVEWIVANLKDAQKKISDIVDKLILEHDEKETFTSAWQHMSKVSDDCSVSIDKMNKALVEQVENVAVALGNEFFLDVFLDVLEEKVPWLKPWGRKGLLKEYGDIDRSLPTLYDLRAILSFLGWHDACNSAEIKIIKGFKNEK